MIATGNVVRVGHLARDDLGHIIWKKDEYGQLVFSARGERVPEFVETGYRVVAEEREAHDCVWCTDCGVALFQTWKAERSVGNVWMFVGRERGAVVHKAASREQALAESRKMATRHKCCEELVEEYRVHRAHVVHTKRCAHGLVDDRRRGGYRGGQ